MIQLINYAIIIGIIIGPILLSTGLMWVWPACRRPLAWGATLIAALSVVAAVWIYDRVYGFREESLLVGMAIFWSFPNAVTIAIVGFVWSRLRPLGIGRGVVVESEDEVKRSA